MAESKTDFEANLGSFSDEKLCAIIIASRYLGALSAEAICCMQELARRRATGAIFDYETFVEEGIKKLPNFNVNLKRTINMVGFDLALLKNIK